MNTNHFQELIAKNPNIPRDKLEWAPDNRSCFHPIEAMPLADAVLLTPHWVLGVEVNWMFGYANAASVSILYDSKRTEYVSKWPDKVYTYHPNLRAYIAQCADGRACIHYHGPATWRDVDVHRGFETKPDGTTDWSKPKKETVRQLTTGQSAGYGGQAFPIQLATKEHPEGEPATLRGPWHGIAPEGFTEIYCIKDDWEGSRTFGAYLTNKIFQAILTYYGNYPELNGSNKKLHLAMAYDVVFPKGHLVPCREDWKPKGFNGEHLDNMRFSKEDNIWRSTTFPVSR